jgi:hypothetical protein
MPTTGCDRRLQTWDTATDAPKLMARTAWNARLQAERVNNAIAREGPSGGACADNRSVYDEMRVRDLAE